MKKLKYVLIALVLIILCVGGYIIYELNFKSYDTADPEVDTLIDEKFDLELPDGTVINIDKDGNVVEGKKIETNETAENIVVTGTSNSESSNSGEDKTETNNTKGEENSTATNSKQLEKPNELNTSKENKKEKAKEKEEVKEKEKVTVSMIKSKYESTFNMLENQSRARLNSLIGKAANEYSTKKSNGESISYGYFYKKYMGAAKGIESATDSTVSYVVGLVEKDLQANGYDKSYAQSFEEDYKATKEALRSEMMRKVLNFR